MFFYRVNRWRFNSKDYSTGKTKKEQKYNNYLGFKTFRFRYQILASGIALVAYGNKK